MSRKDSVLLACGSRSMSSVGLPRSASAAARLMAVVVFPTPPFWLAIATIMLGERAEGLYREGGDFRSQISDCILIGRLAEPVPVVPAPCLNRHSELCTLHSHLVLAHVVRIQ